MSASEPPDDPNAWDPDDTGAVPVGPEPEPTGAGGAGAGGWGRAPRLEPFAIAALVWAIVSIAVPLVGTIIAFVLAARAADLIRRSHGEKAGLQYVTAARVVAGGVLAIWIVGLVAFLALRGDDSSNHVAVPTQPPTSTVAPTTSSTTPLTTTTTKPLVTTTITAARPTITVVPPPPTTAAPPPTTAAPTTVSPPTTTKPPPTTTKPPPTSTTNPDAGKAAKVQSRLVQKVGMSNRGVPEDERFVVEYTPGQDLLVTWAINNGSVGEHPTGTPSCTGPPTSPPSTSTPTSTSESTSTSTTTTTTTTPGAPTTTAPGRTTPEEARVEAKQILASIKPQLTTLKLDVPGVQLVGTYPLEDSTDDTVVQVLYSKSTVQAGITDKKAFDAPPAEVVQCLNPAFALS